MFRFLLMFMREPLPFYNGFSFFGPGGGLFNLFKICCTGFCNRAAEGGTV